MATEQNTWVYGNLVSVSQGTYRVILKWESLSATPSSISVRLSAQVYFNNLSGITSAAVSINDEALFTGNISCANGAANGPSSSYWSKNIYNIPKSTSAQERIFSARVITSFGTSTAQVSVSIPPLPSYIVSYNANGGQGAPGSQRKYLDVNLTLSSVRPTREGYNFLGWGTSSSSTAVTFPAGSDYTFNQGITLYAVWEKAKSERNHNLVEAKDLNEKPGNSLLTTLENIPISNPSDLYYSAKTAIENLISICEDTDMVRKDGLVKANLKTEIDANIREINKIVIFNLFKRG